MAIGGFSGTDPTPTLQQFQDDVANHRVAYYLATGSPARTTDDVRGKGGELRSGTHADIQRWVRSRFPAVTVGGVTAYDLLAPDRAGLSDEASQQR